MTKRDELIDRLLAKDMDIWPTISRFDACQRNIKEQRSLKAQYLLDLKKKQDELDKLQERCPHPVTDTERADSYEPMITWCLVCGAEI